ncbi:unnamed protein product, partial [Meganyctiphanes norvegica]
TARPLPETNSSGTDISSDITVQGLGKNGICSKGNQSSKNICFKKYIIGQKNVCTKGDPCKIRLYYTSQTQVYTANLQNIQSHINTIHAPLATLTPTVTSTLSTLLPLSTQRPTYGDRCQCVPEKYCNARNILTRLSPTDINYQFDPRSGITEILSNSTEVNEEIGKEYIAFLGNSTENQRDRRDLHNVENASKIHTGITDVSLNRYIPGPSGCSGNHVCCRNPLAEPRRPAYTCGKSNTNSLLGRIHRPEIKQGDTEFAEYPWQAAILRRNNSESIYVCGAVLIDEWHVLTAVHCLYGLHYFDLKVRLGEWDVGSTSEFYKHVEFEVSGIIRHPEFYKGNLQNDIAVLRLSTPVDFDTNPHVSPVCLPTSTSDYSNQICTVTGWGKDAFGTAGQFQRTLKEVELPVMEHQKCQNTLRGTRLGASFTLQEGMMCAGGEEDKDACKGDGGSPLVCQNSAGAYELAGLVSWGIGCGQKGIPGVYVDVHHYLSWITAIQHS